MFNEYPPQSMWDMSERAIVVTHVGMMTVILAICGIMFVTARRQPERTLAANWGRGLTGLAIVGLWVLWLCQRDSDTAAYALFLRYLFMAIGIGVIAMEICEYRFGRSTSSVLWSVVNCGVRGIGRVLFIAISAIAFAVLPLGLFPVDTTREAARFAECRGYLKLVGLGIKNYIADNDGAFPHAVGGAVPRSWRVELLPYIDHAPLRRRYDDSATWDDNKNLEVARQRMPYFRCASDGRADDAQQRGLTSYVMVTGAGSMAPGDRDIRAADVADGLANTALLVEAIELDIVWTEPRDTDLAQTPVGINRKSQRLSDAPGLMSSTHPRGRTQMLMGDGSVRTITNKVDAAVLKALTTRNGGEPMRADW